MDLWGNFTFGKNLYLILELAQSPVSVGLVRQGLIPRNSTYDKWCVNLPVSRLNNERKINNKKRRECQEKRWWV